MTIPDRSEVSSPEPPPRCGLCDSTKRLYDGELMIEGEWRWVCRPCLRGLTEAPAVDENQGVLFG